jgi:hypothetical protein
MPLNRNDEQGLVIIDSAEISRLVKESHFCGHQSDSEDSEDDTLLEYCSDDEGGATIDVDSDDE